MSFWWLRAVVGVLLLAGCSPVAAPPTSAEREDIVTRTAQVQSVDLEDRSVLLLTDDGRNIEVVAGPEVRNLPQLALGDTVRVTYYEAVAVSMADAGTSGQPVGAVVVERAPEGAKPGMAVAEVVNAVVEFVSFDPQTNVASYLNPDGTPGSVVVRPEMQEFAAARKAGDRIDVTITQAVALSIDRRTL